MNWIVHYRRISVPIARPRSLYPVGETTLMVPRPPFTVPAVSARFVLVSLMVLVVVDSLTVSYISWTIIASSVIVNL